MRQNVGYTPLGPTIHEEKIYKSPAEHITYDIYILITVVILDNEILYRTHEGHEVTYNVETGKISTIISKEERVISK